MVGTLAAQQGFQLWQQRRLAEAVAHLQRAVELSPGLPQAHLNLALALRDSGRFPEALYHAERGSELLPGDMKAIGLVQQLRKHLEGLRKR